MGCVGPQAAEERTRAFLEEHPGKFTDEERAILDAYTIDGLGHAVRDAESRFLKGTDDTRDSAGEYYRRVFDLVAAVARVPPAPMSAQERQAYDQYTAGYWRAPNRDCRR